MSRFLQSIIAMLTVILLAGDAMARKVTISGRHSRAEIAGKCHAIGGARFATGSKSGSYGCFNARRDTTVECDSRGRGTGRAWD